jgi:hypothetical protein
LDLNTLFSPVTVPEFLDQYFGRSFLHIPGTPEKFSALAPGEGDEPVAILAQDLERALEAPIRVNPPGHSTGLAQHRRERDGILLQVGGQSDCKILGNTDEPAGNSPAWEGVLGPGDALYIPRGWWIELGPGGLQISLDVENPTGADLLAWLVHHVGRQPAFRSDIPRFADPATKADYVTGLRQTLSHFLRAPGLLEKFRRETNLSAVPQHGPGIPWRENAPGNDWIAFLTPRKIRIKRGEHENILLVAMGKRLGLPQEAAPLLHYLSDRAPVPVEEFYKAFEGDFDRAELSDLLSVLSKDGIIGLRKSASA